MLVVDDVSVRYGSRRRLPAPTVVDGVSLTVAPGEIVGLVGESGCGKTTLARAVVGAVHPYRGRIELDGLRLERRRPADVRRRTQMVFQDPGSSLDPRHTVGRTLTFAARHDSQRVNGAEVEKLLAQVGLPPEIAGERPGQLSGGQRQRVAIARALATEPDVIVADEVVASLDVSAAGAVLNLLSSVSRDLGVSVLFISHDLSVVRALCDRTLVMYLGEVVEEAATPALFANPGHPYTRALIDAIPSVTARRDGLTLIGDDADHNAVGTGCRYRGRCPLATDHCAAEHPQLVGDGHRARCHYAWTTPEESP